MNVPLPDDVAERLATGLAVLDAQWRVRWLNGALAEMLEVGVRGLRGQPFDARVGEPAFAAQAARVLAEGREATLRGVALTTLQGRVLMADLDLQPVGDGRLLVEAHALNTGTMGPTPLSATLRGFAHEVKNPLAGLRGAAQLLERRLGDADLKSLATMVIGEADRLAALADRLLHHDGAPRLEPINVHELLERVVRLIDSEPHGQPPGFQRDYDPSLPVVVGDAGRLHQVLLNLARNAVEAGAGHMVLRTRVDHGVRLGERVVRMAVRVEIVDDGTGVPEALHGSLFQPLVSGRPDGTGLGLALAQEIAREHGGELRHASRPGETVFSLYLPLEDGHD